MATLEVSINSECWKYLARQPASTERNKFQVGGLLYHSELLKLQSASNIVLLFNIPISAVFLFSI